MTVGELKKIVNNLEDDYKIQMRVRKRMADEEIIRMNKAGFPAYPYPYITEYTELEFDDVGVSDRVLCLGCEIKP